MAVTDYSVTPALNVTISGTSIAEGCPPGNLNNAVRQMMADVRVMYNGLPSTAGLVPANNAVFNTVQPTFSGRGAFAHHIDSGNSSFRVSVLPDGSANPAAPSNGDMVFFYAT